MITATALIQCVTRSQSGWIVARAGGGGGTASCVASTVMARARLQILRALIAE